MSKKHLSPIEKLDRHRASIAQGYLPVVFCVKCGSTLVDQASLSLLRCCDCGNSTPWDGRSFSINRDASKIDVSDKVRLSDAVDAFRLTDPASDSDKPRSSR